jgi:hypothetical protein
MILAKYTITYGKGYIWGIRLLLCRSQGPICWVGRFVLWGGVGGLRRLGGISRGGIKGCKTKLWRFVGCTCSRCLMFGMGSFGGGYCYWVGLGGEDFTFLWGGFRYGLII